MPDWEGSAGQDVKGNRIHISLDQGKGNIVGVCLFVCLGRLNFCWYDTLKEISPRVT